MAPPRGSYALYETYEGESITIDLLDLVAYGGALDQLTFSFDRSESLGFGVTLEGSTLIYEPIATLSDTITIRVADDLPRLTEPDMITIDILVRDAVPDTMNRPPIANSHAVFIEEGTTEPIIIDLSKWGYDPDGHSVMYSLFVSSTLGITQTGVIESEQFYGAGQITLDGNLLSFVPDGSLTAGESIDLYYQVTEQYGLRDLGAIEFVMVPNSQFARAGALHGRSRGHVSGCLRSNHT